jgi:mono/diheme cytochrome c family protein
MSEHNTVFIARFGRPRWSCWLQALLVLQSFSATAVATATSRTPDEAAERPVEENTEVHFVRRILPLLTEKCLACHGADPQQLEGSLDLTSRKAVLAGGDSEQPSVLPGKPDQSPLYLAAARMSEDWSAMPPKEAEKLTKQQLEWLRQWIASGAEWPGPERRQEIAQTYAEQWDSEDGIEIATSGGLDDAWTHRRYDPESLWAYRPIHAPELANENADQLQAGRSPIDLWIDAKLPVGLSAAPRADRRTLIRRATFDLTGLPPSPTEVQQFLSDPGSDRQAFAALIDRLLESPHYGERMAQHWLDVVRYADSSGFANDFERGNAWRYRDYVVRAFNSDKPYSEFIREQIAGDELDADNPERIIATGFLRMGPWELTGMEVAKIARQRFLDDVTNSVGETFLAHSLQCARCHDHKFDPVPTRDYYSIQAVFATTQLVERQAEFLPAENVTGFEEREWLDQAAAIHQQAIDNVEQILLANSVMWYDQQPPEVAKKKSRWLEIVAELQSQEGRGKIFAAARKMMQKEGFAESDYPPNKVGFTPRQFGEERVARKGLERLRWELERYQPFALAVYNGRTRALRSVSAPQRVPADRLTKGQLEQTAILTGGDPFSAAQPVQPGILSVIGAQVTASIPGSIEGRRLAFADWIADKNNPLTSRVMVNRIWLWHFGKAIAGNPNNFGSTGKRPSHPALLDWLASAFVQRGWSVKAVHRLIMNSETYCRSTVHPQPEQLDELDPEATSFAVFQPRRLTAEELRDSMLAVTGELNQTLGGIPCRPEINQEVALQPRMVMGSFAAAWVPNCKPQQRNRRSLYVLKLRGLMDPMLEVFNSPAPDFSCERREVSTVTPQVFSLFNGQSIHTRALTLAARAARETSSDEDAVRRCFELALSRLPTSDELQELMTHWHEAEQLLPADPPPRTVPPLEVVREAVDENTGERFVYTEQLIANAQFVSDLQPADVERHVQALADLCLVIFNANEFVYVY